MNEIARILKEYQEFINELPEDGPITMGQFYKIGELMDKLTLVGQPWVHKKQRIENFASNALSGILAGGVGNTANAAKWAVKAAIELEERLYNHFESEITQADLENQQREIIKQWNTSLK